VLYVPGEKGLAAFELPPGGAPPKLLWQKRRLSVDMASPLVLGNRTYGLRGPVLLSADARTGEVLGKLRLTGPFSASAVSAGGLLYCVSEEGLAQVVAPGEKEAKLLHAGSLGETILATPAVADGALYVGSDRHLWKIAAK
jgi:hypothetical protein